MIPATQDAETGESLEPRGRGCSQLRLHNYTLDWATRAKLQLQKKKQALTVLVGETNYATYKIVKRLFLEN